MAPELIEMQGSISSACDIWSLGCTVIELLTGIFLISGHPPFYDMIPMSALFNIVKAEHPPLPDGISNNCQDFLMKCF